jgi:hypothetical protein
MGPYWDSLPKQGQLITKETFPRESLALLQDDSMVIQSACYGNPPNLPPGTALADVSDYEDNRVQRDTS